MKHGHAQSGQALISVLYTMVVGLLVTTGAAFALIANIQAATGFEQGTLAHSAAESGIENAILRYIRNPAYTGETLVIDDDRTAEVTVSSASGIVVTSTGTYGSAMRRIEATMHYNGGVLVIDSWTEIP